MAALTDQYLYANINSNATTVVKHVPGKLHSIVVNTVSASSNTCTIYDNTAGSGTKIGTLSTLTAGTYLYDVMFNTGLTIVTATGTAPDITVCYA